MRYVFLYKHKHNNLFIIVYFGSFICEVGKERGQVIAIAGTKICDGVIDCVDGGDEMGCSKLVVVLF